jgi:hypothetical protein
MIDFLPSWSYSIQRLFDGHLKLPSMEPCMHLGSISKGVIIYLILILIYQNNLKNTFKIKKQTIIYIFNNLAPKLVAQRSRQSFPASASWVQALLCTPVIPTVLYLSTVLAGCSVGPRISRGACKLARIPRIIRK